MTAETGMKPLARLDEIPADGCGLRVELEDRTLALFREGDEVFALNAVCPHRGGPLDEGDLEDGVVVCPWHGWDFDVRTGESPTFGERVECYPVEVRDGIVYLKENAP